MRVDSIKYRNTITTPLSTLYNSLILKGLKFNNFLAKNCKPSIYRALEKRVESQVITISLTTISQIK
ncbi:hypothetical protein GCM10010099_22970 [Streptomyces cinereus]|jgi:hypothetical protein|nr:hypothetical protein GCM10010099_22970 [Streptomyces cinereus]